MSPVTPKGVQGRSRSAHTPLLGRQTPISLSPSPSKSADANVPARGVTAFEGADCGPAPTAFFAATRNVYVAPFVRPVTTWLVPASASTDGCAAAPMYGVMT